MNIDIDRVNLIYISLCICAFLPWSVAVIRYIISYIKFKRLINFLKFLFFLKKRKLYIQNISSLEIKSHSAEIAFDCLNKFPKFLLNFITSHISSRAVLCTPYIILYADVMFRPTL